MAFVKSGWLLRQSTVLRRWKKNWFDLWSNGYLVYFEDQLRQDMVDRVHMRIDCINIRVGNECKDLRPPEGTSMDRCLQIVCRYGKILNLIAESAEACLAWEVVLQSARTQTNFLASEAVPEDFLYDPSSPYSTTPQQMYGYQQYPDNYPPATQIVYDSNGQAYAMPYQYGYQGYYHQPGTNHIIIQDRYGGGYRGGYGYGYGYGNTGGDMAMGMLAGAATGMALGSLFWMF